MGASNSDTTEEKPRRRRWRIWIVGAVLAIAVFLSIKAPFGGGEFSFLDQYHPVTQNWRVEPTANYKRSVCIFGANDAPNILPALEQELGTVKGYFRSGAGTQDQGMVSFNRRVGFEVYSVVYLRPGPMDSREIMVAGGKTATIPEDGCIVIAVRPLTWLERQVEGMKRLLHMN